MMEYALLALILLTGCQTTNYSDLLDRCYESVNWDATYICKWDYASNAYRAYPNSEPDVSVTANDVLRAFDNHMYHLEHRANSGLRYSVPQHPLQYRHLYRKH
jgi:hypothetical protein